MVKLITLTHTHTHANIGQTDNAKKSDGDNIDEGISEIGSRGAYTLHIGLSTKSYNE